MTFLSPSKTTSISLEKVPAELLKEDDSIVTICHLASAPAPGSLMKGQRV